MSQIYFIVLVFLGTPYGATTKLIPVPLHSQEECETRGSLLNMQRMPDDWSQRAGDATLPIKGWLCHKA